MRVLSCACTARLCSLPPQVKSMLEPGQNTSTIMLNQLTLVVFKCVDHIAHVFMSRGRCFGGCFEDCSAQVCIASLLTLLQMKQAWQHAPHSS